MEAQLILSLAVGLCVLLLLAESQGSRLGKVLTKIPLSMLFLVVAHSEANFSLDTYDYLMTIGLICGFFGDVFLLGESRLMFLSGLVVFLIGHIFYIIAFFQILLVHGFPIPQNSLVVSIVLLVSFSFSVFYFYLSPHVKEMQVPVLAYVLVITVMVFSALLVFHCEALPVQARNMVLFGAIMFFISDLGVARQQFVVKSFLNPATCLPAYYIGQFVLAYSQGIIDLV